MDGPLSAGLFWCFGKLIGSGHVYGLEKRPLTAALMEIADRIPIIAARCDAR